MRTHLTLLLILSSILIPAFYGPVLATPVENVPPAEIQPDATQIDQLKPEVRPKANIPDRPVVMFIKRGTHSRFEVFFVDLKYDYELVDFEYYNAWCLEKGKKIRKNTLHEVRLYNCYDPDLPIQFRNVDWNQVNYILNHSKASKADTQEAIWYLMDHRNKLHSAEAKKLIKEAEEKGKDYVPGEGELIGIICHPEGEQSVVLEFLLPPAKEIVSEQAPEIESAVFSPPTNRFGFPWWLFFGGAAAAPLSNHSDSGGGGHPPTPPEPTPEPGTLILLGTGLAFAYVVKRIKKP